tara:strand:+ start:1576 stop:1797 length:222 start_codon:yes stop_codon:yes gene_type:complete
MNDFYQTQGGRRFIDGTMVTIAQSLKNIDQSLKQIVKQNEELKMRTYVDKNMALVSDQKSDHEFMDRKLKENE